MLSYPWWVYVVLFVVAAAAAIGGWWLYRQVKPKGTENEWIDRSDRREPMEAVEGFTRRWALLQTDFMRRVAMALVTLAALIAASLGINVTLYSAQRDDDQARGVILMRLNSELKDRRERSARTDRQQCEDIERLKANARQSAESGRKTIKALSGLTAADKAVLIASSEASEKLFAPRSVTVRGRVLKGVDACGSLPNAEPGGP